MAWIILAGVAAAGIGVTRWYRRSGEGPMTSYSESDQDAIKRKLASRPQGNPW
jgi:hypothetical protein